TAGLYPPCFGRKVVPLIPVDVRGAPPMVAGPAPTRVIPVPLMPGGRGGLGIGTLALRYPGPLPEFATALLGTPLGAPVSGCARDNGGTLSGATRSITMPRAFRAGPRETPL